MKSTGRAHVWFLQASLMMCTLAMVDELQGTGVKVNSMCPGMIPDTSIGRHGGACSMCCFKCMVKSCCCCCLKPQTNEQGGAYIVDTATHERGNAHGLFFVRGDLKDPPPQCQDKQKQVQMLSIVRGYTSAQKMWLILFTFNMEFWVLSQDIFMFSHTVEWFKESFTQCFGYWVGCSGTSLKACTATARGTVGTL